MNEKNFEEVTQIVKVLVANGCSLNTPNDQLETPFCLLLKKIEEAPISRDLVRFVLTKQEIDFFPGEPDKIVDKFGEKSFLHIINRSGTVVKDFDYMMRLLDNRDERKFSEEFPNFINQTQSVDDFQKKLAKFLKTSVAMNLFKVIEVLLNYGVDVNWGVDGSCAPAFTACQFGHFAALEKLLGEKTLKFRSDRVSLSPNKLDA